MRLQQELQVRARLLFVTSSTCAAILPPQGDMPGTRPWGWLRKGAGREGQLAGDTAAGTGSQGSAAGAQGPESWLCPLHAPPGAPPPLSLCWPPAAAAVTWATWRASCAKEPWCGRKGARLPPAAAFGDMGFQLVIKKQDSERTFVQNVTDTQCCFAVFGIFMLV